MVAISKVLLFASSVCASVLPRQTVAKIQEDLNMINSGVTDLDNSVKSYNGGLFAALPVQSKASDLEKQIESATTDANNTPAVNEADSASVVTYITNTLEPNIATTVKDLIAKKSQFQSAGVTSIVKGAILTLKDDTDNFGPLALLAKAAAGSQSSGMAILAKIDGDFDMASSAYSS